MLDYTVKRSARKTVSIRVKDGKVTVLAPYRVTAETIQEIVLKHRRWIEKRLSETSVTAPPLKGEELCSLYEAAKRVIPARVAHFAPIVGVSYGRVTIRSQKTRWGSCSSTGNLNFNCLLMLTPPEVIDSVVVHELCHRKEMNHSKAFYAEVLRVFPDYWKWDKWLKENGDKLMRRMIG
jgi:predicted metal-dependent hydrolase